MRFVVSLKGATKTMTRSRWSDSVRLVNNLRNRRRIRGGGFDLQEEEEVDVVDIVDVVDEDIDVVVVNDDIDAGVDTNGSLPPPALPQRIQVEVEEDGDPPGVKWSSTLLIDAEEDDDDDDDDDDDFEDTYEEDMEKIERDFGGRGYGGCTAAVPPFRQERGHQERRESHVSILSLFP